jgi:Fe-S oxidoreductase
MAMSNENITFWIGCHALRHGDIITTCISILERLGVEVQSAGGPRYCCGTLKDMNTKAADIMGQGTTKRLNDFGSDKVVTYCPSCQTHMDDFVSEFSQTEFEFGHLVTFLYDRREKLAKLLTNPVRRRVLLHLHSGFQSKSPVNDQIREILSLVPGLEVVDQPKRVPGIHCTMALVKLPGMRESVAEDIRDFQRSGRVDDVVTIFHSCHRWLSTQEGLGGLRVTNFVKLLAMSMGLADSEDTHKEWRQAGDEQEIRETIGAENIDRIGNENFERLVLPELLKAPWTA